MNTHRIVLSFRTAEVHHDADDDDKNHFKFLSHVPTIYKDKTFCAQ
jgi:hypothetical protein